MPSAPTIGNTGASNEIEVILTSPILGVRCNPPYSSCRTRPAITATMPTGITAACAGVTCASGTNADCMPGVYDGASGYLNQKAFTCYVQMQYYDEPVTVTPPTIGTQMWYIYTRIEDSTGNADSANSEAWTFATSNSVWYTTVTELDITPSESLIWSSAFSNALNVIATDTRGDDNVAAGDTGLTLRNRGNKAITSMDLTPQDLLGTVNPAATLLATAFSVGLTEGTVTGGGTGACDVPGGGGATGTAGTALAGGTLLDNYARSITYIADGTDSANLFFCIWPAVSPSYLTGGTDKTYQASGGSAPWTAGEYWELIANG